MRRLLALVLLITACEFVQTDGPDAQGYRWQKDGSTGAPVVHYKADVFLRCGLEHNAKSCAVIHDGRCDVYLPEHPEAWQEAHERRHCDGWTHPDPLGNSPLNQPR